MENLWTLLKPTKVKLDQVLLDPNNPRFAELGEKLDSVPETRFGEEGVQRKAQSSMREDRFDVAELRDTIRNLGFLPMDRIVVRPWRFSKTEDGNYIVVEGNRRIAALKWLIELHNDGKESLTDEQLSNFTEIEVLVLDDSKDLDKTKWILPGLRHVSGIKEWAPYQKAVAINMLRELGYSSADAAQSLGLKVTPANRLWRSFWALRQMEEDEEYSEFADARMFSYFEEAHKKPNVRTWLGWDEGLKRFTNSDDLREFYGWISKRIDEEGQTVTPKLAQALDVRDFSKVLENQGALEEFRKEDSTLTRALAKLEAEKRYDWRPIIISAEETLDRLSPSTLKVLTPDDIDAITRLQNRIAEVLEDRRKLLGD